MFLPACIYVCHIVSECLHKSEKETELQMALDSHTSSGIQIQVLCKNNGALNCWASLQLLNFFLFWGGQRPKFVLISLPWPPEHWDNMCEPQSLANTVVCFASFLLFLAC